MEQGSLPGPVADEILRRYADVLRVGNLKLNGIPVVWTTDTSTKLQLHSFCENFSRALKHSLPVLAGAQPDVLRRAAYWFCKAVSINYALIEVVLLVRQQVGVLCTIETREDHGGPLVEYCVQALPGNVLRVSMLWEKDDNIIYCNPHTARKEVKGTLSCLETEFSLPPAPGFVPAYSLQMRLKKSLKREFAARLTSTLVCGASKRAHPAPTIHIDEPLRSDHPLETFIELATDPAVSRMASRTASRALSRAESIGAMGTQVELETSVPSVCGADTDELGGCCRTEVFAEDSIVSSGTDTPEPLVGQLRVRVIRARRLKAEDELIERCISGQRSHLYVTCTVGAQVEQTRAVPRSSNPEWFEALHFPVVAQDLRGEVVAKVFSSSASKTLRFLGSAAMPVSDALGSGGAVSATFPLDGGAGGSVQLELELLPTEDSHSSDSVSGGDVSGQKAACHEDECIVEVGTTMSRMSAEVGTTMTRLPPSPQRFDASRGGRGPDFRIQIRAGVPTPKSLGFWCSRPCTVAECI